MASLCLSVQRYCCCFSSGKSQSADNSQDQDDISVAASVNPFHDLVNNPQQVDQQLDNKISTWQKAIFDYENMELDILLRNHDEDQKILVQIRDNPHNFLNDNDDRYKTLARKRIEVMELEGQFPSNNAYDQRPSLVPVSIHSQSVDLDKFPASQTENQHVGYFTERLSQIWSNRLNKIDPTQGAINILRGPIISSKATEVFVRPKWPDFLTDVCYDVFKVSKYGQQLRRVLKFTQNHVISIKNGTEVTKFYHYLDIRRVGLRSGNHIYVLQKSGKKNIYQSPIAPHILQQLTTRVQVRRSLDKAFLGGHFDDNCGYDTRTAAGMIKAISENNTSDTDAVMTHFANMLRDRTIRSLTVENHRSAPSSPRNDSNDQTINPLISSEKHNEDNHIQDIEEKEVWEVLQCIIDTMCAEETGSSTRSQHHSLSVEETGSTRSQHRSLSVDSDGGSNRATINLSRTAPMLTTFPEHTPEHAVQEAVRKAIFDPNTPEGNTRKVFVDKFRSESLYKPSSELVLEIRHFIDGMHEHMVFSRAFSLAILYQQQLQKALAVETSPENGLPALPAGLDALVKQADTKQKFTRRASLKLLMENNLGPSDVDESLLTIISYIIFIVVEEATFLVLKEKILSLVQQDKGYVSLF
jgi:hypothetical protein